jgi:hypothetical protein
MHRLRCLVVIGALTVAVSVVAAGLAAAAKGGNSDNAHACQQGGSGGLAEAETGNPFKNAGDCTSHGAQGGATAGLQIDTGTYSCPPPHSNLTCWGTVIGSGLQPGSPWTVLDVFSGATLAEGTAPPEGANAKLNLQCIRHAEVEFSTMAVSSAGQTLVGSFTLMSPCG